MAAVRLPNLEVVIAKEICKGTMTVEQGFTKLVREARGDTELLQSLINTCCNSIIKNSLAHNKNYNTQLSKLQAVTRKYKEAIDSGYKKLSDNNSKGDHVRKTDNAHS